ncbi:MAG TPA: hypothetical protein VM841_08010 [Actinomycetota bacterium]|nr:hypothetical protein [Actinomycetota bacterium]
MIRRSFCILATLCVAVAGLGLPAAHALPCYSPGLHVFLVTDAKVTIVLDPAFGGLTDTVQLSGPTLVQLSGGGTIGGKEYIDTEILNMDLQGVSTVLGPIQLTESPLLASTGRITQLYSGCFPAESTFDVYVEAHLPMLAHNANGDPVPMRSHINSIPPSGAAYHPPINAPLAIDLYAGASGTTDSDRVGKIIHAMHVPLPEWPFFSVQPNNRSGLDPASLYYALQAFAPPVPVVPAAMLGLQAFADDVDAISTGIDPMTGGKHEGQAGGEALRFSVAEGSIGAPGSGVESESAPAKIPQEASMDEFEWSSFNNFSNHLFMPGTALGLDTSAPPLPSDDLDALMSDLNSVVKCDGGTPGPAREPIIPVNCMVHPENIPSMFPIYFSLAAGSPTLAAIGATPADILRVDVPFGTPVIDFPAAAMGLGPQDDLDALCNYPNTDANNPFQTAPVFSLRDGSPSLTGDGGDVFAVVAGGGSSLLVRSSFELGLKRPDDLNALKCNLPAYQL